MAVAVQSNIELDLKTQWKIVQTIKTYDLILTDMNFLDKQRKLKVKQQDFDILRQKYTELQTKKRFWLDAVNECKRDMEQKEADIKRIEIEMVELEKEQQLTLATKKQMALDAKKQVIDTVEMRYKAAAERLDAAKQWLIDVNRRCKKVMSLIDKYQIIQDTILRPQMISASHLITEYTKDISAYHRLMKKRDALAHYFRMHTLIINKDPLRNSQKQH